MSEKLPPIPVGTPLTSSIWANIYERLRRLINEGSINQLWTAIDFTGSNITDIVSRAHNNLQSIQGGAVGDYYHLTVVQHTDLTDAGDSALHYHATDRARANHTGTQTISTLSDLPTLAATTYSPILTNTTNLDGSTSYQAQYSRVGATVTVSGRVDVDPTAAGQVQLGISIPVASNFGAPEDCAGVAFSTTIAGQGAGIYADIANDRATLEFIAIDLTNQPMYFTFSYQII